MKLHPKRPPGRVDRKAAAYATDIAELRGAGYTTVTGKGDSGIPAPLPKLITLPLLATRCG